MALPSGLPTVTVSTGPHTDYAGTPCTGTVTVTPSVPVVWAATGQVLHDGEIEYEVDAAGALSVQLPANDADGLTRTGFTYTFAFDLATESGEKIRIIPLIVGLPQAAPTVDLDILTTITSTTGVPIGLPAVTSVAGLSGVVSIAALQAAISSTPTTRTITAGTGLTGGGDLTANRTLALTSAAQASLTRADTSAQPGGDLTGTTGTTVTATHLAAPLPLTQGGTGAANATGARTALELGTAALADATDFLAADADIDGGTP